MCMYVCVSVHMKDTEEVLAPLEMELQEVASFPK